MIYFLKLKHLPCTMNYSTKTEDCGVKRVILDCDVGTDDYVAVLMLLYAETIGLIKIEAISCCNGNTALPHTTKNLVRLLELVERTDIPVYKGVSNPIIGHKEKLALFHGEDGFGDLKHDKEPDLCIVKDTNSVTAIRDIIVKNPKQVSLMCVGPLTNLALSFKLYDDLVENMKDLWIMGGNFMGVGNISNAAEFNFYADPEAANIVLELVKCPTYILPWETCLIPKITFDWRRNELGDKSKALALLTKAEQKVYPATEKYWGPPDAFCAFAFLNPEKHIKIQKEHYATVELNGFNTRGQVVLDHAIKKKPNIHMIEMIDAELFKEFCLNLVCV